MPESILESVLNGKLSVDSIVKWLNTKSSEDAPEECALFCCNKGEFVAYFLSFLRSQTDSILQTNTNALQILQHQSTPEKIFNTKRKHQRSVSEPTSACESDKQMDTLSVRTGRHKSHDSPGKEKPSSQKKSSRRVKTKLFTDADSKKSHENRSQGSRTDSDESRISLGVERLVVSSTPMKNGTKPEYPNLPSPMHHDARSSSRMSSHHVERCDTPKMNHRYGSRVSSAEKSVSLGDYILTAQKSTKKKKSKNVSNESIDSKDKVDLDLSNSDVFPEIGAKRSSQKSGEKRRIKPTILDNSGSKINSFNDALSPIVLEENVAFKHQNVQPKEPSSGFEAERNFLKQERHKLMEKFNILNTSPDTNLTMPQIKITRKDSTEKPQNLIKADVNKVNFKTELDSLVVIYDVLLKNNLILNINGEMYFLISILLSKQYECDYSDYETKLTTDNNYLSDYILKSIHNSSYFAVKTLWRQKYVLEVMLEKNSLKLFGENKRVRSFCPDLAKFLLNLYGLKCDAECNCNEKSPSILENRSPNGIICFNFETDNSDNFPTLLSFQNFKKQRDLFYEILRWWSESQTGVAGAALRSRVKSLISLSATASNHAHLARLIRAHMLADCLAVTQESKLTKLQRRLTGPAVQAAGESHRLPKFTGTQIFYRDLIMYAESEAFRIHLRDALASELCHMDSICMTSCDERSNLTTNELAKEYLTSVKKLRLLSKFLGFLAALPYSPVPAEYIVRTTNGTLGAGQMLRPGQQPKEKVSEMEVASRNYSQPPIDMKRILQNSMENNRLCVTLPWMVQYLAMLDYTSLRINYYKQIIKCLFHIYTENLKICDDIQLLKVLPGSAMKKTTQVFLKLFLGWFFDLTNFPRDIFYENNLDFSLPRSLDKRDIETGIKVDFLDLIGEAVLREVCPFFKDVNTLLMTSKLSREKDVGTFRHITPTTMSLNPMERIKNKERELQARLEEEFVRGQPSSTRRVLEMLADRVTSATVKELVSGVLVRTRNQCRMDSIGVLQTWRRDGGGDTNQLLNSLRTLYSNQLRSLRSQAMELSNNSVDTRSSMALQALLAGGTAKRPLESVARRSSLARINKWIDDNWSSVDVLCKDIEGEMRNLLVLGENLQSNNDNTKANFNIDSMMLPQEEFDRVNVSPSSLIIDLKEQICLLLDYEEIEDLTPILERAHSCCKNVNIFKKAPSTRAIHQMTVELCIVYISRKPKDFHKLLDKLHAIWNENCPDRRSNRSRPERRPSTPELLNVNDAPKSPKDSDKSKSVASQENKNDSTDCNVDLADDVLQFFDRILCPRNIVILSSSKCKSLHVWDCVAKFLVFLLKNNYLTEDSLTEQCLAVYRQDWPQHVLENLSVCMKTVSNQWGRTSAGKFTLFLDFLTEYCNDMDYDQDVSVMS